MKTLGQAAVETNEQNVRDVYIRFRDAGYTPESAIRQARAFNFTFLCTMHGANVLLVERT